MKYLMLLAVALMGCGQELKINRDYANDANRKLTFLVAGQSNAVSPAQYSQPAMGSASGLVTINDVYDPVSDKIFRIPVSQRSGMTWLYLGDMMNRHVTFNNIARGGRSTQQWVDTDYVRLIEAMKDGRHYDAVLWVQGESDSGLLMPHETSYQNMLYLMSLTPGVPWYVALDGDKYANMRGPAIPEIRLVQERLIREGKARRGPDIDALREIPGYFEEGKGEFGSKEGYIAHAAAWYAVLNKDFGFN